MTRGDDLGAPAAGLGRLLDDDQVPGLRHRLEHGLAVPGHQRLQVDDLGIQPGCGDRVERAAEVRVWPMVTIVTAEPDRTISALPSDTIPPSPRSTLSRTA